MGRQSFGIGPLTDGAGGHDVGDHQAFIGLPSG
jgi:hypothetical protein